MLCLWIQNGKIKIELAGCQLNDIVSTRINYPKGCTNLEEDLKKNVQDMISNKVISIQVQKVFHPIQPWKTLSTDLKFFRIKFFPKDDGLNQTTNFKSEENYNNEALVSNFWAQLWNLNRLVRVNHMYSSSPFYSIWNHTLGYFLNWHVHFYHFYLCYFGLPLPFSFPQLGSTHSSLPVP